MKTKIASLLGAVVVVGAALTWQFAKQSNGVEAAASPIADAVTVDVEWFIGDAELVLGSTQLRIPHGMNVRLMIDSDAQHQLAIADYGVQSELIADAVTPVHFHAYKNGVYEVRLNDQNRTLGTLEVYAKNPS